MKRLESLSERLRVMHEVFRSDLADGPGGEADASTLHFGLALNPTNDALKPSGAGLLA